MNQQLIVSYIAEAREKRAKLRAQFAKKGKISVSVNLNIPGYPKTSNIYNTFFKIVLSKIKNYLLSNRIFIVNSDIAEIIDKAGDFFIASVESAEKDAAQIKNICENFEEQHKLGRLIDIDITDVNNVAISSNKAKMCFVCKDKPAIVCMRDKNHDYKELRNHIDVKITKYIDDIEKNRICKKLSSIALKSILYEISLTPKPGLVDKKGTGIHSDMNYYSFLNSSSVISSYFNEIAIKGYESENIDISSALPLIRETGLQMEKLMFEETQGVNTQKGIIFLISLVLFASAKTISENKEFCAEKFINIIKAITQKMPEENKAFNSDKNTHGKSCYQKYGEKYGGGIRLEVSNGLPTVFNCGLVELKRYDLEKTTHETVITKALISTLLAVMANNNDTNVLYRGGLDVLKELKEMSSEALKALNLNDDYSVYDKLIEYCLENKVSPGGSADLLAITIYVYFVEKNLKR